VTQQGKITYDIAAITTAGLKSAFSRFRVLAGCVFGVGLWRQRVAMRIVRLSKLLCSELKKNMIK